MKLDLEEADFSTSRVIFILECWLIMLGLAKPLNARQLKGDIGSFLKGFL